MLVPVQMPIEEAERYRLQWERAQARRWRYEQKTGRTRHDLNDTRTRKERTEPRYEDYRFVAWDGEAPVDTGYSLFGSSDGHELCHPDLRTEECLNLLLEAKRDDPYTIFIWFGGRYDFDEIIRKDIPTRYLRRLKESGVVHWHGYRLTEAEGKIYSVSRDGVTATVYEIHSWFHKPYVLALDDYQVGTKEERDLIREEKANRPEFTWSEIERIRKYMRLELRLMPPLMDKIRDICHAAGFRPRNWFGPSALARELLTRNHVKKAMAICPREVNDAACIAFAGGRFEEPRGGHIQVPTWTYDKNSAYMHAAVDLPNLSRGRWVHHAGDDSRPGLPGRGSFAVYRIRYKATGPADPARVYPLFRRMPSGNVCWPRRVEGWYWSPEAGLVEDDPGAQFLECWEFVEDDPCDRPFEFVREVYRRRLLLQGLPEGNPSREAEQAIKWALAAIYGQIARAVGWDKKKRLPPATHQIEWAGYILSHCRAAMHRLAEQAGSDLVSIDTDSVTSMRPLTGLKMGKELGEWKVTMADSAVYFQNGVFFTMHDGKWSKGKARGVEKRIKTPDLSPEMLIEAIETGCDVQLTPKRKYVTVRMALNGQYDNAGKWLEHPGNVLVFGGGGKRYHNRRQCPRTCDGDIHVFLPAPQGLESPFDVVSCPHVLPWKEKRRRPDVLVDTLWVNTDDIDDETWLAELVMPR